MNYNEKTYHYSVCLFFVKLHYFSIYFNNYCFLQLVQTFESPAIYFQIVRTDLQARFKYLLSLCLELTGLGNRSSALQKKVTLNCNYCISRVVILQNPTPGWWFCYFMIELLVSGMKKNQTFFFFYFTFTFLICLQFSLFKCQAFLKEHFSHFDVVGFFVFSSQLEMTVIIKQR